MSDITSPSGPQDGPCVNAARQRVKAPGTCASAPGGDLRPATAVLKRCASEMVRKGV